MATPIATSVKAMDNYKLLICFDSGESKIFDVTPYVNGSWYGELADQSYFKAVFVNGYSVEWPHGQDLCPDEIYCDSIEA